MISARPGKMNGTPRTILCLGAHSDDIEIGCGGTILRLLEEDPNTVVHWTVFSAADDRAKEARGAAARFLKKAKAATVETRAFRDAFFPYQGAEIKESFETLKAIVDPDLIFTHFRNDGHQDHRLISELTWNTFRNHMILEYEIPKYDGDLGSPNVFVPLRESVSRRKVELILKSFHSQREKAWFTAETFMATLRLRGIEANSVHKYAEAFYCRKLVLRNGTSQLF